MAHVVILGGGLTGLSTAYYLEKKGFSDFEIFEKEKTVGGLCRSVYQDGFTFDFTGHLLHINNEQFREFIQDTIGFDELNSIKRRSLIYSHGIFTPYPFQVNLKGLPIAVIAECIDGYVNRLKTKKNKNETFVSWVHRYFGKGFARHFFMPYQEKIFSYDLRDITASWTSRFVPSTSLEQIIRGIIGYDEQEHVGYNAQFFYPRAGGIYRWIEKIHNKLVQPVRTEFCVTSIDMHNRIITFSNGHEESFTYLVNTLPLDIFLGLLKETSATTFVRAARNLVCNSVMNFNIGIRGRSLSSDHWIYFPEKNIPFYRVGFPHNFSTNAAPEGCSSLYGEVAYCNKNQRAVNTMVKKSIQFAYDFFNITMQERVVEKIIPISHAYVIYNFWREKYLPRILSELRDVGIISVGRYGAWKYASMQESVLDGKGAADIVSIIPAVAIKNKRDMFVIDQVHEKKGNTASV